jgi:hypothetical protein
MTCTQSRACDGDDSDLRAARMTAAAQVFAPLDRRRELLAQAEAATDAHRKAIDLGDEVAQRRHRDAATGLLNDLDLLDVQITAFAIEALRIAWRVDPGTMSRLTGREDDGK